ncbi:MAG: DUF3883 domain-containing protein [Lachnospiraceae bacterium]|nr:DUF3883 domain-containing protein [Lachnospiraceae bacterium]
MLNVLKSLKYHGGKEGLLFFICDVIGYSQIRIKDAKIICAHANGKHYLSVSDLISYCCALGWLQILDDSISVSPDISAFLNDKEKLNDVLIISTVNQLFEESILDASMFYYDTVQHSYAFKNELLPLSLSCVRNVLISQGFLIPLRNSQGTRFYIAPTYDTLVAKHCKERQRQLSLEKLKKQLESNELAGEKAELFVLEYEKKRLGLSLCEKVKRISEIDVTAGYDIVSFDSDLSQEPDRFIEVKATSNDGFYWSRNEYEIAKLKGDTYYLYLVDLTKVNQSAYLPQIIKNPAINVIESEEWFIETQSYFIKRI